MSALQGRHIVVTRAAHQAAEVETLLRERGAVPLLYPCIDIAPPDDPKPLDEALRAAASGQVDWLVLTSANTVLALANRLETLELAPTLFSRVKVAAIGAATAKAARDMLTAQASVIPDDYVAESLAQAMQPIGGASILLPQSAIAEPTLGQALSAAGGAVTVVEAYQTVIGSGGVDLPALLASGQVDALTFTSSSTVTYCIARLQLEGGDPAALSAVCIACIGPKTAATARKRGLPVHVQPDEHTVEALVAALDSHFSTSNPCGCGGPN